MHCLVLAGGNVRPDDPLYGYTQGRPKALIDMGGRSMLERVIEALQSSTYVEDILIVGLEETAIRESGTKFARDVNFLADHGSMVANMQAGVGWFRAHRPGTEVVLGCSADIPAITGRTVDEFIEACRPWDKAVYYNFITRQTLETRFPNSNRTYSKLNGLETAGGDMVIARLNVVENNRDLLDTLTNARKQPWRVASVVGFRMLLKFLLRRVSIADIEETAARILNAPVKIILDGPPELAMDADKPHQVDLLRAEFAR